MGSPGQVPHTHIDISHVRTRSPSLTSQDDELHEHGVQVSPAEVSPPYSVIHASQSQSGSSSHPGDYVRVLYPTDYPDGDGSDVASRVSPHDRPPRDYGPGSRADSAHPPPSRRASSLRAAPASAPREVPDHPPTEAGDSAEDFIHRHEFRAGMPRPQSYYDQNGYPHSSSSGSFAYAPLPHSNQVVSLQSPPIAVPYPPPPPMSAPPTVTYAAHAYPGTYAHPYHAPTHVSSPYTPSPYGAPTIVNYAAPPPPPASYFPSQYPHPPPSSGPPYPGQYMPFPQQMPYPYVDYRGPASLGPSSPPTSATVGPERGERSNPEDLLKRFTDMMKEEQARGQLSKEAQAAEQAKLDAARAEDENRIRQAALREAEEKVRKDAARAEDERRIRDQALVQAAENARAEAAAAAARAEEERRIREEALVAAEAKARADAAALAERMAAESRIREEARQEAMRAYEEKVRQAAEQAAREQQIRKEAAEAALKAAAEEAAAKAEKAAADQRIAEAAAAAAKSAAEKEAAEAAAKAQEEAHKAQEEAAKKLKEAEEAAAKAKLEAEEADKRAAAATPAEKKPPVRFKDAIGRNYNFPWERCCRWRDMESLINQAFAHIEGVGEHVLHGRYDLIGPDKEIIMPQYWESTIEPDMHITMMLWPIPEPPKGPGIVVAGEGDPDGIIDLSAAMPKRSSKKDKKKSPGGFASWMLGGSGSSSRPARERSLKDEKRPDVTAFAHGESEPMDCAVM